LTDSTDKHILLYFIFISCFVSFCLVAGGQKESPSGSSGSSGGGTTTIVTHSGQCPTVYIYSGPVFSPDGLGRILWYQVRQSSTLAWQETITTKVITASGSSSSTSYVNHSASSWSPPSVGYYPSGSPSAETVFINYTEYK
jgi:hypothetical protein